jgi:hypothetical protein
MLRRPVTVDRGAEGRAWRRRASTLALRTKFLLFVTRVLCRAQDASSAEPGKRCMRCVDHSALLRDAAAPDRCNLPSMQSNDFRRRLCAAPATRVGDEGMNPAPRPCKQTGTIRAVQRSAEEYATVQGRHDAAM